MVQKIRVGAVSYLNTKPLIFGFEHGSMKDEINLVIDYPSKIAALLIEDKIDIGLVPVAIIPLLKEHYIVSDYGIACNGEVASVCLFSDVPLYEIETVLLDYQSRTSVTLLKLLLQEYWKISVKLIAGNLNYENEIGGTTAGLVIGDRALVKRQKSKFIYDLGSAWKEMTGFPFVFAAWVSNKKIPADFVIEFNKTNEIGLKSLDVIVKQHQLSQYDLHKYYTENIIYRLDKKMRDGMQIFLKKMLLLNSIK